MAKLKVTTSGDRAKPALLLVHALGTDGRFWEEAVADLEKDYFCIVPDLRASGRTLNPPDPVTAPEHAADLAELLDDLEISRAVYLGCAVGGMVAATLAGIEPQRAAGLVMTNPGLGNADSVKAMLRARVDEVRTHGMKVLLPSAPERSFSTMRRDRRFDTYVERYSAMDPESYALTVLGFLDIDIRPVLPNIKCPVLLIPGGLDTLMPADGAEQVAALVPQAQTVPLPDVAHFVPFQAPEKFTATVRPFLANKVSW